MFTKFYFVPCWWQLGSTIRCASTCLNDGHAQSLVARAPPGGVDTEACLPKTKHATGVLETQYYVRYSGGPWHLNAVSATAGVAPLLTPDIQEAPASSYQLLLRNCY